MKVVGYGDVNWESLGFGYGIPAGWMPTVSTEPLVITRPGTTATFGIGTVGHMLIPGHFLYYGSGDIETAFIDLFKRLDPIQSVTTPKQLRCQRNTSTDIITIPACIQLANFSDVEEINVRPLNFIAVRPFWQAIVESTGSGAF